MPHLTDEEYLRLLWEARQGSAPAYAPAPPPAPAAPTPQKHHNAVLEILNIVAFFAAMVGAVLIAITVYTRFLAPQAPGGSATAPLPTALVTAAPVREVPVVQRVEVPVPVPPVIIIASPTPVPAGVSVSADQNGVTLAVSNGPPAPAAAPPPPPPTELPRPGEPGFVESFKPAPTLGPANPFIGCLPGHNCGP